MSISNSYPTQRPSLNLVFNGGSDQLDSRISYSRSSTGTYMSNEKALNSENLLLQSQDFDTTWSQVGLSSRSGGNADPAGGTTAHRFVEDSSSATHRVYQTVSSTGKTSLTVYAKQAVGTRYLSLKVSTGAGGPYDWIVATYDLAGGTPAMTTGTGATSIAKSSAQTLSGGGFYKCTLTVESSGGGVNVSMTSVTTPSPANYGHIGYTGDGASAIDVAFSSLNSTGATDYNATTTQIHREFAPTLKTSAANEPRFEYAADGQSVGLLIEAQKTNLALNSSSFAASTWNKLRVNVTDNVAVGPDGQLSASLMSETEDTTTSHFLLPTAAMASGYSVGTDKCTHSVYAKSAGKNLKMADGYNPVDGGTTIFDLVNGTVIAGGGSIESCGNGWWRCSVTVTMSNSVYLLPYLFLADIPYNNDPNDAGDGYSGVLLFGMQSEQQSMSSYIATGGSAVSRASDSCSVDLSQINYLGGEYTLVADADTLSSSDVYVSASLYKDNSNYAALYANGLYGRTVVAVSDGVSSTVNGGSANGRIAVSGGTNSLSTSTNGGSVTTDTSYAVPDLSGGTLYLGTRNGSSSPLNGNLKRLSLYSAALSNVELQSLTS